MKPARAHTPFDAPRLSASARLVVDGLLHPPRSLPSWFVRGAATAELRDAVTGLRERATRERERELLERVAPEIAERTRGHASVVEPEADGRPRVGPLLDAMLGLRSGVVWAPVNADEPSLSAASVSLARRDPRVEILPLPGHAAATGRMLARLPGPRLIVLPTGRLATLGPDEAAALLRTLRAVSSPLDTLLIGFDQRADGPSILSELDDPRGIGARFALGALERLTRELRADFDRRAWRHEMRWSAEASRVEHHLVARLRQPVFIDALGRPLLFEAGEGMLVERSQHHPRALADHVLALAGLERLGTWEHPDGGVALVLAR
ncbi:MAG: L-histidine N(alpha)-methyltransferase [Deltaproteobacteria bacterium]|nr:L-histidine N(alpha)-methyltransferase [Deltaproteobacteria bacterium]